MTQGCCAKNKTIQRIRLKLFTKEDRFFFHKVFGLLSVLSYFYRYGYVYNTTGTLGFTGDAFDWLTIAIHMTLSASSLIFHVPKKRMQSCPLVIYEEYRNHAVLFTLRGCSVYAFGYFLPNIAYGWILQPLMVLAHHVVADMISNRYGKHETVRVGHQPKFGEEPLLAKSVKRSYSLFQFLALGSHLLPAAQSMDLGFNPIIGVQSSAFLMTLYKKGIISGKAHVLGYSACLIISLFHMTRVYTKFWWLFTVLCAFFLRCNFGMNKYILWIGFSLLNSPPVQAVLRESIDQTFLGAEYNSSILRLMILPLFVAYFYTYRTIFDSYSTDLKKEKSLKAK